MSKLMSVVLTTALFVVSAIAQSSTGSLIGTVSGPDGALPGATVVVKDNNTQREQTFTANDEGVFTAPQLEFGTYTVTVTAQGFRTFVANDLKIDVGRQYSLNPTLEIGSVTEEVTVTAGADIVNATSPQISNTVSPQQILSLPLVARDPLNLIRLQAGTASNGFQQTSINGMRTTFTNITRDGINIQDSFIRANATDFAPGRPSVDDTGEFTVATSNGDSDQGYGGAQVRLVTPRGGSEFHGALFAYNRNSAFGANNFFSNRAGEFTPTDAAVIAGRATAGEDRIPRPFRNRNQYGGKIGGPMPIPRFGEGGPSFLRNKGFFFFAYEGIKDPVSTLTERTILTPSARGGAFNFNRATAGAANAICPSGAANSVCTVPNLLTFARGLGLNGVPATIDSAVQSRIIDNVPAIGNRTDIGDNLNTTGFALNRQSNSNRDTYTTRLDYVISDRHQINGVFSYNSELNLRPDADNNPINAGFTTTPASDQSSTNKTLALAYQSVLTNTFTNEVRGGLFFSDVPFNRNIPVPSFFVTPTLITTPETQFRDQGRSTKNYNIQDNADLIAGNHNVRFGGMAQFFEVVSYNDAVISPTYTLGTSAATPQFTLANFAASGGISNAQLGTANNLLALLGGIVNGGSQGFNTESRTSGFLPTRLSQPYSYDNISFYAQDRWRISPRLTVSAGLRYELFPALELDNGLALEPVIPDGSDPIAAILNPAGTYGFLGTNAGGNKYYKTDKNNFAPSVGFAYTPQFKNRFLGAIFGREEGRTVIRGGYSQTYGNDSIVTSINNAAVGNVGLGRTGSNALNAAGTSALINDRLAAGVTPILPPAFVTPPRTYLQNNTPTFLNFGTVFAIDPELTTPRVDQYSFGIQREIGFQTAVEIRYVGSRSGNLARSVDYNQIDIFRNGFLADFNRAAANLAATNNAFCTPGVGGCQALSIFRAAGAGVTPTVGRLIVGTGVSTANFVSNLQNGTPADLALSFIQAGLNGGPTVARPTDAQFVNFLANPATGVANVFENGASYNYNSLQVEFRRRFAQGLYFQANYTFSKNLTNAIGTSQTLVEPFLDINNRALDNQRADYDQTHVFNFNSVYELPFGNGRAFFGNANRFVDRLINGFRIAPIVSWTSGSPITFIDTRGTLNRTARSGRQTPNSNLTNDQIKALAGTFDTARGIFFVDPSVIATSGRASEGFGLTPFQGQAFFNVNPGQTGNVARSLIDSPGYFNLDLTLIKEVRLDETRLIQLRMEAFNALNNVNFLPPLAGQVQNINSSTFGQLTRATLPRIVQFAVRFEF